MNRLAARKIGGFLFLILTACGGGAATKSPPATPPQPDHLPLAGLAATGAIVTPTYALRAAPEAGGIVQASSTRDVLHALDEDLGAALAERGLKTNWVMPADLVLSYKRNPMYAPDPFALALEPLRSPGFRAGLRLPEPLASQLRMIIALHDNARAVLLPIELHLDPAPNGAKATLKLAVVDPRFSEAQWVGAVQSDTTSADVRVLTRSIAKGVADLITSR